MLRSALQWHRCKRRGAALQQPKGSWLLQGQAVLQFVGFLGEDSVCGCLCTHVHTECDAHMRREIADVVDGVLVRRPPVRRRNCCHKKRKVRLVEKKGERIG